MGKSMSEELLEEVDPIAVAEAALGDEEFVAALRQINEARIEFCYFLASVFLYELTDEELERLAHLRYEDDGSLLAQGYAQMVEYLRHRHRATAQELRVDFARAFLGAGVYDRVLAPPYESVFTSKERLIMQDARDKALYYYRSEKLDLAESNNLPEDHLSYELQFIAKMIERTNESLRRHDVARVVELVDKQRSFFKFHQANWLPRFCQAMDQNCRTEFYHGVANLVRGYLQSEHELLDDMARELGIQTCVELRPGYVLSEEDEELMRLAEAAEAAAGKGE